MLVPFGELFGGDDQTGFRPRTVLRIGALTLSRDVLVSTADSDLGAAVASMVGRAIEVRTAADGALEVTTDPGELTADCPVDALSRSLGSPVNAAREGRVVA